MIEKEETKAFHLNGDGAPFCIIDIICETEESKAGYNPELSYGSHIVHVYDVSDRKCEVFNDVANEHLLITC